MKLLISAAWLPESVLRAPRNHLVRLDSQGSIRYDPCNCMQSLRALTLGVAALFTAAAAACAQVPRASDGDPDLSANWQTMGTANWDLEDHASEPGPFYKLGAIGPIPLPDTVVIRYEMIHETRLIPLDNRPRTKIRSYMGEPRGHWEGNTLVVGTTNFIGGKFSISGPPYSEDLVLTERFTRVALDVMEYSVRVNDPKTWVAPWTATFPLTSEPGDEIFEYACHEGNYAMRNRLSAARILEAKDAATKK